jgi:arylsulfatase A-like enzyme
MIRNGQRVEHEGYVTDIITDRTLDWLSQRDKSKPFCMMMQHKAPHREWDPPLRHLGHDHDRQYPVPETLMDDYSGRGLAEHDQDMTLRKTITEKDMKLVPPPQLKGERLAKWNAYYEPRNAKYRDAKLEGDDLVRWRYQRYMHDYLGCVKAVDESVGRVLEYLEKEGLADNTIVVYSADQGFYLGEHGWFDKRWIFEESLRTPLLVRWPGKTKPGSVNHDLVSNVDYAETFLDVAGVSAPADMQGRSLVSVLKGETPADWRKSFYYQYYEYPTPHHVRPHYGVVTDRYKLVHFYEDADYWELFDRKTDPLELKSVYGQADYASTQQELSDELARLRQQLRVPEHDPPEASGRKLPGQQPKRKQAGAAKS